MRNIIINFQLRAESFWVWKTFHINQTRWMTSSQEFINTIYVAFKRKIRSRARMFCFAPNFAEFTCSSAEFLNSLGPANHNRLFFFRISCVCDFWLGKLIRQAHLFPTLCTLLVNSMLIILVFSCLFFSVCHPLGHRNLCSLVHADTFHSPKNCSNLSLLVND